MTANFAGLMKTATPSRILHHGIYDRCCILLPQLFDFQLLPNCAMARERANLLDQKILP